MFSKFEFRNFRRQCKKMASNLYSMSNKQREFLRKKREYLKQNLNVDHVLAKMTGILSKDDDDSIRAETTRHARVQKLLDLLPFRGAEAFNRFIIAVYEGQKWLGEVLAREAGVDLDSILPSSAEENPGMKDIHHQILRSNLPKFQAGLDVDRMVENLRRAEIITVDNPGLSQALSDIKQEQSNNKKVEKLICEVLPQLGPNAYSAFISILHRIQPQFAHEFEQDIKKSHPDFVSEKKSYPVTESNTMVAAEHSDSCSLSTPCSKLPENVSKLLQERLDEPNEMLENDWKKFYKVLKLPEGKEHLIAENPSPTRSVMKIWIDRDGKQATVKKLLEALYECPQGGLADSIEQMLGVGLELSVVDGFHAISIEEDQKKNGPIRIVKDIPQDLKRQFISRLNGVKDVLSDVASNIMEERCYFPDAADFLEKISNEKTRILFRELRKKKQFEITEWMREKFPPGSTGPVKSDDELRAGDMNYGYRREITKFLTAKGLWESLASHPSIDMKQVDVDYLKNSGKDCSENVLSRWEVRNKSTVGTMYDLLVDCDLLEIADLL